MNTEYGGWEAPGASLIWDALNVAARTLGIHETVLDLYYERVELWGAMQHAVHVGPSGGYSDEVDAITGGYAAESILRANQIRLRKLGVALSRWDGDGVPPGSELFDDWTPSKPSVNDAQRVYENIAERGYALAPERHAALVSAGLLSNWGPSR